MDDNEISQRIKNAMIYGTSHPEMYKSSNDEIKELRDRIKEIEAERDALLPWKMFYADGQSLGEIAKHFDKSIYDFSPWITAPAARIALEAIETKTARIMELLVENAHLRRKLNPFGAPQYGEPGGPI